MGSKKKKFKSDVEEIPESRNSVQSIPQEAPLQLEKEFDEFPETTKPLLMSK